MNRTLWCPASFISEAERQTGIARVIYFILFPEPLVRMASELNKDPIFNGSEEEKHIHPPDSAQGL